jgi:hypothetical protein
MEGSLVAYKVFTNGSTLQASELNENLMQQATAVFSNAAARTAAITSPVEGQLTYLEDVNLYHHWNGSAWVSPFGLTLLANTTFTAQSSVSINDVFSSEFDNYKVVITTDLTSGTQSFLLRYRVAGADNSTANYTYQLLDAAATSITASRINSASSHGIGTLSAGSPNATELTIYNPNRAERTVYQSYHMGAISNAYIRFDSGVFTATTQFTGFTIFPASSTITGRLQVYGLRK